MKKRVLSLVLALTMVLTLLPLQALAVTINDDDVFLKQSGSGKCTLTSAVMMLRRRAIIDGNADWKSITETTIYNDAWMPNVGLNNSFSYMGMDVSCAYFSSGENKKAKLIELLGKQPEGIEIYDKGIPHAVLLTDYDSATDTFYCADPAGEARRIKLSESWNAKNRGGTQDGVINNLYKYWYITNKEGGGPGLVTVSFNANGGTCDTARDYVTASGTLSSLPTATRDGYRFLGWFTAAEGGTKVDTSTKITADMTVYAQWKDATVRGTCGPNLSWSYNEDIGTLAISGKGEMTDWVSGAAPWYEYRDTITRVELGSGIKNIGSNAFKDLTKLKAVVIKSELQKIGDSAFENCSALTSLEGIDGVQIIGASAFKNCVALAEVGIPDGCVNVGAYAFSGTAIKSIHVPSSTQILGEGVFSGCTKLQELSVYSRAESLHIASNALRGCVNIKSVSLDCRSLSLDNNAFPSGANINYVMISGEYGSVASRAFSGVTATIVYPQNGTKWSNMVGSNFGGTLTWEGYDNHVHGYTAKVTAPTCSEQGYTTYTCTGCGESFVDTYVPMLGHHFENGVCTRCGKENPFTDINAEGRHKPFTDAILWAAEQGITTGYGDGVFAPDKDCSRAQVVTFLWRAAGSPEPESSVNPFDDVNETDQRPYYKAILWAVEQGITNGLTATEFSPNGTCTRAQFVTFLWRYMDKPANSGVNPFTDVAENSYYDAILWAAESGVTTGYGNGIFRPSLACSRAHVVTFIYRAMSEK